MIDCFVLRPSQAEVLAKEPLCGKVHVLDSLFGETATLRRVAADTTGTYTLLYTKQTDLALVHYALERLVQLAGDTGAALLYADHFRRKGDAAPAPQPLIDYQAGALRDDFDFGGLLLYRTDALKEAVSRMDREYKHAALYDLRLKVSQKGKLEHVGEYLYYEIESDLRSSGEKLFDYVDPKNRSVQVEMEQAVTEHLKAIGGYLAPVFKPVDLSEGDFPVEASVVIPCKNRVRTIGDALASALSQKTDFPYNVIVVDDNSTDGTVEVIKRFLDDPKLIYIAQDSTWHGIGGNWNAAIHHPQCGRFALQLDSDDKYHDETTVQQFVDAFRSLGCAMVVGCYEMTDLAGNPLPPYVIEHREWTDENGRNNALRVNGLGAPRGFWVPLLRRIGGFPTTKYGEDYAVGLRISREYRIGRVWNVLYTCRRWEDNSDGNLSVEKVNANNYYKDRIRTWELGARMAMNRK